MKRLCPSKQIVALVLLTLALPVSLVATFAAESVPPKIGAGASPRILIAYYSLTGNTEQMAGGVAEGIRRVPGVTAIVKKVDEVTKQDLEAADGIILGSPTYYANIPGKMKVAIDDWSWKMKVDFRTRSAGRFPRAAARSVAKNMSSQAFCSSC